MLDEATDATDVPNPDDTTGREPPRPQRWRTFIALPLPPPLQLGLVRLPAQMAVYHRDCFRWMEPESIHLTLRFLGGIDPAAAPGIAAEMAAAAAATGRFQLRIAGTGTFPPRGRPRVAWAGIEGEVGRLERLRSRVEGALARVGFDPERRPFLPHLTVGRIRKDIGPPRDWQAGAAFQKIELPSSGMEFAADRLVLFRSQMDQSGATYEVISEAPFS